MQCVENNLIGIEEVTEFITSCFSVCRHNLTNQLWHNKIPQAALQMFGFKTFEEAMFYITNFFADSSMEFPRNELSDNKICIKSNNLSDVEQILIVKMFLQSFPHRQKCSMLLSISRQVVTKCINRWMPKWATFGTYLSMLPIPHDYFRKELPDFYIDNNLSNVTHVFDGKDIIIDTIRKDNNLRRRNRSEKVHDSACRTLHFTSPMGLSFEHTRLVGARETEKKIIE